MRLGLVAYLCVGLSTFGALGSTSVVAKDVRGFPGAKEVMRAGPFEAVYKGQQRGLYPDWYLDGVRTVASAAPNVARTLAAGDVLYAEELRLRKKTIRLTEPLQNTAKKQGTWAVGTTFDLYGNTYRGSYCRSDHRNNPHGVPAGFYCIVDSDKDGRMDMVRYKAKKSAPLFDIPVQMPAAAYEDAGLSEEVAWKRVLVIEAVNDTEIVVSAPILDWVVIREELVTFPQFQSRLETGNADKVSVPIGQGRAALDYEGARFEFETMGEGRVRAVRTADFAPWAETIRGRGVALIETRFPAGQ